MAKINDVDAEFKTAEIDLDSGWHEAESEYRYRHEESKKRWRIKEEELGVIDAEEHLLREKYIKNRGTSNE